MSPQPSLGFLLDAFSLYCCVACRTRAFLCMAFSVHVPCQAPPSPLAPPPTSAFIDTLATRQAPPHPSTHTHLFLFCFFNFWPSFLTPFPSSSSSSSSSTAAASFRPPPFYLCAQSSGATLPLSVPPLSFSLCEARPAVPGPVLEAQRRRDVSTQTQSNTLLFILRYVFCNGKLAAPRSSSDSEVQNGSFNTSRNKRKKEEKKKSD